MGRPKSVLVTVALLFATFAVAASEPDFASARKTLMGVPPSYMDYETFCSLKPQGQYMTGCDITTVPSVGLLVCDDLEFDGKDCATLVREEVNAIKEVQKGGVKTWIIDPEPVYPLRCMKSAALTCTGHLLEWTDYKDGWYQSIRSAIQDNTVDLLIEVVKAGTTTGLPTTAADLMAIKSFMKAGRQICNLQGFFLRTGGFKVADPDSVKEGMALNERCSNNNEDPTTQQVLEGLDEMIKAFSAK